MTLVVTAGSDQPSGTAVSPLGVRVTVDFVQLDDRVTARQPALRLLFTALPA